MLDLLSNLFNGASTSASCLDLLPSSMMGEKWLSEGPLPFVTFLWLMAMRPLETSLHRGQIQLQ